MSACKANSIRVIGLTIATSVAELIAQSKRRTGEESVGVGSWLLYGTGCHMRRMYQPALENAELAAKCLERAGSERASIPGEALTTARLYFRIGVDSRDPVP